MSEMGNESAQETGQVTCGCKQNPWCYGEVFAGVMGWYSGEEFCIRKPGESDKFCDGCGMRLEISGTATQMVPRVDSEALKAIPAVRILQRVADHYANTGEAICFDGGEDENIAWGLACAGLLEGESETRNFEEAENGAEPIIENLFWLPETITAEPGKPSRSTAHAGTVLLAALQQSPSLAPAEWLAKKLQEASSEVCTAPGACNGETACEDCIHWQCSASAWLAAALAATGAEPTADAMLDALDTVDEWECDAPGLPDNNNEPWRIRDLAKALLAQGGADRG